MGRKYALDMTNGPFLKKIFSFALPLMLTGVLQLVYNTADIIVVGRFAGSESLAAVGSTGSLINLMINLFIGISMGSGVMVAKYIGAQDEKNIHDCTHTAIATGIVCGIFVAIFGYFMSGTFIVMMKSPHDVVNLATIYLKIYFLGAPGSLVYNFGSSIIRATGDTKRPLIILTLSGLVNIALNLILVIFFRMGVSGVAIATAVSQYISAIMVVIYLMKMNNSCCLYFKDIRFHKDMLFQIIKIGLPAGIQGVLFSISNVIIQSTVNTFGSVAMAGIAAGSNFDSYIYTCTNAISQTTMTFSSQNIGAKRYYNIRKNYTYCLIITTIIGVTLGFAGKIFSEQLVSIFNEETNVIKIGAQRLELVMPFYVFCSLMDVAAGQLRGMGKSIEPMIIAFIGGCGIRLLWIFIVLPHNPTLTNLFWAYPISWMATFAAQFTMYFIVKHRMRKCLNINI